MVLKNVFYLLNELFMLISLDISLGILISYSLMLAKSHFRYNIQ